MNGSGKPYAPLRFGTVDVRTVAADAVEMAHSLWMKTALKPARCNADAADVADSHIASPAAAVAVVAAA